MKKNTFSFIILISFLYACSNDIINDKKSNLQWTKKLSTYEMEWDEARKYCTDLILAGAEDWRLPTKIELETTLEKKLKFPEDDESPFHEPFILESNGYLFSGTNVEGSDDPYVMRIANGHIFNGGGYKAYVRCVRDKRFN